MAIEKNTVDYFPFFIKNGKTLFILKKKWGLAGIGFFTEFLRFLSQEPEHWLCLQDKLDLDRLVYTIGTDEKECLEMLEVLAMTGKIDTKLWKEKRVVVSEDFLDSLQRVYSRRSTKVDMESIREKVKDFPEINSGNQDSDFHVVKTTIKPEKEIPLPVFDEKNPHTITNDWFKKYNKLTAQFRSPSEIDYLKATNYCKGSPNVFKMIDQARKAIPFYFSEPWWFTTKNKKMEEIEHSQWCFGGFITHSSEIIAWMNEGKKEKVRGSPKVCGVCGKKYNYSHTPGKCIDCVKKEIEQERENNEPPFFMAKEEE